MHISTKMKKEIFKKIEIPEGVEVEIKDSKVLVKKADKKMRETLISKT